MAVAFSLGWLGEASGRFTRELQSRVSNGSVPKGPFTTLRAVLASGRQRLAAKGLPVEGLPIYHPEARLEHGLP